MDIYSAFEGDIYSEYVWPEFWKILTTSRTKGWDGNPRDKTDTEASAKSEKQNYKIPLVQLGLIEPSEGRLTVLGYKLVSIGKIYGVSSSIFVDFLTKLVLVEGKHLILIQDLEHFRMTANKEKFINQEIFRVEFENFLVENKSIGPRKPGRVTTGKKVSYIRDEFKLWNKLGLIRRSLPTRYFVPGRGIEFNWARITDILTKDFVY